MLTAIVDPAAGLGHPQLDPIMLEQRRHQRVPAAVKRPLILPDHHRVPAPPRVGQRRHQGGGLRPPRPRHRPALPGVEELRHHTSVTADQRISLGPLPDPRRHRILPVLRRHPAVKREPQPTAAAAAGLLDSAARPLRPVRQQPARPRTRPDSHAAPPASPQHPLLTPGHTPIPRRHRDYRAARQPRRGTDLRAGLAGCFCLIIGP
jgi:hypothetical protein